MIALNRIKNAIFWIGVTTLVIVLFGPEFQGGQSAPSGPTAAPPSSTRLSPAPASPVVKEVDRQSVMLESRLLDKTAELIRASGDRLAFLLETGDLEALEDRLIERAAAAVNDDDFDRLGANLSLLGQVAISRQDLDAAEVYLREALDVYQQLQDELGAAETSLQLGRLHLKSRHMARTAGNAYDQLLIARWQITRGQLPIAEQNLKTVIAENMSINRFGAAASAHQTLVQLYRRSGDVYLAEQSALEAARLFAASGQIQRARQSVAELADGGVSQWRLHGLDLEIEEYYQDFKYNIEQIGRAADYRRLYRHYRNKGDLKRAWAFRVQAGRSLANVSKRAMYHRQPDVLAVLYNSNDAMRKARKYLSRARDTFDHEGLDQLTRQSDALDSQIF